MERRGKERGGGDWGTFSRAQLLPDEHTRTIHERERADTALQDHSGAGFLQALVHGMAPFSLSESDGGQAVAEPASDLSNPQEKPDLNTLQVFYIPGHEGIKLNEGSYDICMIREVGTGRDLALRTVVGRRGARATVLQPRALRHEHCGFPHGPPWGYLCVS